MITMGPTGNIIKGHVLDCTQKPFEEALRLYDPQLYVKWNPKKLRKHGCWEIRRKPDEKTLRPGDIYEFEGYTISWPKYHEIDIVNHVLDIGYLNYNAIEKLKSMDMWEQKDMGHKGKNLTKVLEYNEAKYLEGIDEKSAAEKEYNLKQFKKEISWFKEYVNSGGNPAHLASYWDKV